MEVNLSHIISLFSATLLGAGIGLEREFSHKSAGLRTNTLICVGACLFTIVSKEMGVIYDSSSTRIAAHIVGGVGFFGAGAIIQDRGGVHGITTAATIWIVASVGISCGAGFYLLALIATIITMITLIGFGILEKKFNNRLSNKISESESQKN